MGDAGEKWYDGVLETRFVDGRWTDWEQFQMGLPSIVDVISTVDLDGKTLRVEWLGDTCLLLLGDEPVASCDDAKALERYTQMQGGVIC